MAVCVNGAEPRAANKLDRFLEGLETFRADFTQTLLGEDGEELETSSGTVSIRRPGRFYWHYTEPYSQYLISDGKSLWVYDEDLEQVTVRDVAGAIDDTPAAILGGDVDIDRYYIVKDADSKNGTGWIELTPRDSESQYRSIRLGFEGSRLTAMILNDSLGQQTRIRFRDMRRNPELQAGLFEFEPPAGVDVIDDRGSP